MRSRDIGSDPPSVAGGLRVPSELWEDVASIADAEGITWNKAACGLIESGVRLYRQQPPIPIQANVEAIAASATEHAVRQIVAILLKDAVRRVASEFDGKESAT